MPPKKLYYFLIFILLTPIKNIAITDCTGSIPNYIPRSQSVYSDRELFGWIEEINRYRPDKCDNYLATSITFEYSQTFQASSIARSLIGRSCLSNSCDQSSFNVTGSRVARRGAQDWLADYFGLPTDFESSITLSPQIKNYLVDFNAYIGLDNTREGLYFRVHAPVVRSTWKLNYNEHITNAGVNGYDGGYFSDGPIKRNALLSGFSDYVQGESPELLRGLVLNRSCTTASSEITASNLTTFEPLAYSKWASSDCHNRSKTKLSDIIWAFGWNYWQCDNYHAGFNIRGALPTGNRPSSEFLFEPIVGNGHHWELGAGFTGHYTFWYGCESDNSVGIYVDANVTHLFADSQCRVFDLKNRCNSRYMLAINLAQPVENLFAQESDTAAIAPNSQFKYHIAPVANLTKERVKVTVNAQVDATVLLNFRSGCNVWSIDVGYNFWYKSPEKFNFSNCLTSALNSNNVHWALKGDSQIFGYTTPSFTGCCNNIVLPTGCTGTTPSWTGIIGTVSAFGDIIPLSPSQHCATIHAGQNNYSGPTDGGIDGIRPTRNPGVDNAQFAYNGATIASALPIVDRSNPLDGGLQMKTSLEPIFLSWNDVDITGAQVKGLSNSIFFNFNYSLSECWNSFVSLGGKIELGLHQSSKNNTTGCATTCNTTTTPTSSCSFVCGKTQLCAPSSWSIWFKGGVSFN